MADVNWKLEGLDAVLRELARRQGNTRRQLRDIINAGADIIRDETKRRAKGRIQTAILRRTSVNPARVTASSKIGPEKSVAYIARFLELGTAPHEIRARRGRLLRLRGGRLVRSVRHPGARPYPFMTPAFEASKGRADAAIAAICKRLLEL